MFLTKKKKERRRIFNVFNSLIHLCAENCSYSFIFWCHYFYTLSRFQFRNDLCEVQSQNYNCTKNTKTFSFRFFWPTFIVMTSLLYYFLFAAFNNPRFVAFGELNNFLLFHFVPNIVWELIDGIKIKISLCDWHLRNWDSNKLLFD